MISRLQMASFFCAFAAASLAGTVPEKCLSYDYTPRPVEATFKVGGPDTRFEPVAYKDVTDAYPDAKKEGLRTISYNPFPSDRKRDFQMFAYLGIPDGPAPAGGFPALVFGHGGCGLASAEIVDSFKSRGFVAISMSCEANTYAKPDGKTVKLKEFPGLPDYADHLGAYVRANTILRSLPMVNKDKVVYLGQSWGGVKGSILSCLDTRFKCFILLSGCGFWRLGDKTLERYNDLAGERLDPGWYLAAAKGPLYWINGTNDRFFGVAAWQRSAAAAPSTQNQLMLIDYPHARFPDRYVERVLDHELNGGAPLPKLGPSKVEGGSVSAELLSEGKGIKAAVLFHTEGKGPFLQRKWSVSPATVTGKTVSAAVPAAATQYCLAVFDEAGDFAKNGGDNGDYKKCCGGSSAIITLE